MNGTQVNHPGIQIEVRGISYTATWTKAHTIALALDSIKGTVVDVSSEESFSLQNVSRKGDIIPVGIEDAPEDRHRRLFTINATVTFKSL